LGFRWIVELKCNAYGDREQDVTEIREELSDRFEVGMRESNIAISNTY